VGWIQLAQFGSSGRCFRKLGLCKSREYLDQL